MVAPLRLQVKISDVEKANEILAANPVLPLPDDFTPPEGASAPVSNDDWKPLLIGIILFVLGIFIFLVLTSKTERGQKHFVTPLMPAKHLGTASRPVGQPSIPLGKGPG